MGHKILLADDSITIQKVIELTFSDEDFELHTVGNGQKAIDEVRGLSPDVVLCDIIMPEKNGYEVCEFIKSQDDLRHVPVLLLTGAFEPFDQERAKAAGCDGFLAKPFEPQTLISKVKELLATAPSQSAAAPAAAEPPPVAAVPEMFAAEPPPAPPSAQSEGPASLSNLSDFASDPSFDTPEPDATIMATADQMAPPAPEAEESGGGLAEDFAIEAGERELSMDASDHSMLLGDAVDSSQPSAAPAPAPVASEDIWSDVGADSPSSPPASEPQATAALEPPAPERPEKREEDPDATWQMPATHPEPEESRPVAATPDFGDFGELGQPSPTPPAAKAPAPDPFDAPPATPAPPESSPEPPAGDPFAGEAEDPFEAPEPPAVEPIVAEVADTSAPFESPPPTLEPSTGEGDFQEPPQPIPSVNTEATIDPVLAGVEAFAPLTASAPEANAESDPTPVVEPDVVEAAPPEPQAVETPPAPAPEEPAVVEAEPAAAPEPTPAEVFSPPAEPQTPQAVPVTSPGAGDDELVERIAKRVVEQLSSSVLQEIAWEVVPDLAENILRDEIEALKAKMPK